MKQLNQYIIEKFKINSKNIKKQYNYHPKTYRELRNIIVHKLEENKDADLNDIDVSEIESFNIDPISSAYHGGLFQDLDPHNIKIDQWDVSNVTNMAATFENCNHLECDLSNWDVSNVKNMNAMFWNCYRSNAKIIGLENWDVSNVEDMGSMFVENHYLKTDFSNWDVSNVKDMHEMFQNCKFFKGIGLEKWKISNVKDMKDMFVNCKYLENNPPKWYSI